MASSVWHGPRYGRFMTAIRQQRTDEVPPPPPSEKSLRDSNGGVWPPKDRLVALGSLLTTKRATAGQDASRPGEPGFPTTPRVPRLETPSPWPTNPDPHPWVAVVRTLIEAGKKHAQAASVIGAVGVSFAIGALLGSRRGRRARWNPLAH